MSQQNVKQVRRAIEEIWNRGNYTLLDEFVARDIVIHGSAPDQDTLGADGVKAYYGMLRGAFPDLHFEIEDQVAAGDRVVTRWTARGTHQGEFLGIPPTGKPIVMSGIYIDRLAGGKVVECWPQADQLSVLQQLGAPRSPEPVAH